MAEKPTLIFDGKCGFCRIWIEYWKELTGDTVDYAASQDVGRDYPQIDPDEFKRSVQLVLPSGEVLNGAEAVFRTLRLENVYDKVPGAAPVTEWVYRIIAAHRDVFYWLTVLMFGRTVRPLKYDAVERLFRKALAVIWFIAFASFAVQAMGLIGSRGIMPAGVYLARVREYVPNAAWLAAPTVFWLNSSDSAIQGACFTGMICALLAFFGVFWRGALFGAFALYLSLMNVSQEFLSYQWDILLLETGFLAVFLGYSRAIVWLFRWLLFRLMFLSGAVKLLSGDETWRNLTALMVHYQTQPIPTPLAWYAHQAPAWFQKLSCAVVFFVELAIPILVLGPRRFRTFALPFLIGLQVLILLTGNYAFFNWLAIALCIFLIDDSWLPSVKSKSVAGRAHRAVAWSMTILIGVLSGSLFYQALTGRLPAATRSLVGLATPFGLSSSYGLFATMTTRRPEIVIEGSSDGTTWLAYEFRYKPGRPDRAPPWVAPHQPRLDWQMWFAALGTYRENGWFVNTLARLLQGSPEVLALIERNPFPDKPPRYIRAQLYDYRFTEGKDRNWWTRTPVGMYVPAISLENLEAR
jgi:predicted DCC family thiol-disulfide oxidoreductase YuxK